MKIQCINMEPFWDEGQGKASQLARTEVVRQMAKTCREVGLFTLVGHRVSPKLCADARHLARQFFELPLAQKQEIALAENPLSGRGHQKLAENTTYGRRDWHEAIDLYRELPEDHTIFSNLHERELRNFAIGKNRWPSQIPGFEQFFSGYVEEMLRLGAMIMKIMALGLNLQEDFFEPYTHESFWVLRMIGYPPLATAPKEGAIGTSCGEHTDYGLLTLVNQDPSEGSLEAQTVEGQWIAVPNVEGSFVINLGDMLEQLTGKYYRATPHRVVHYHNQFRVSLPFFFEPNFDATIAPIDGFAKKTGTSVGMYGRYLYGKVSRNFTFA